MRKSKDINSTGEAGGGHRGDSMPPRRPRAKGQWCPVAAIEQEKLHEGTATGGWVQGHGGQRQSKLRSSDYSYGKQNPFRGAFDHLENESSKKKAARTLCGLKSKPKG